MYLGNAIIPKESMVTSRMQQRLNNLPVSLLVEGNEMVH